MQCSKYHSSFLVRRYPTQFPVMTRNLKVYYVFTIMPNSEQSIATSAFISNNTTFNLMLHNPITKCCDVEVSILSLFRSILFKSQHGGCLIRVLGWCSSISPGIFYNSTLKKDPDHFKHRLMVYENEMLKNIIIECRWYEVIRLERITYWWTS